MDLNVNNLARSGVILLLGLPVVVPLGLAMSSSIPSTTAGERAVAKFKDDLTVPCLKYVFSRNDSKAERTAKNDIDDVIGGDVNHGAVCKYVL